MVVTHVTTTIASLAGAETPYEADFLVDTGALGCLAPASALTAAGITPVKKKAYELARGEVVEYDVGFARLRLLGDETVVEIILGPKKAEPIFGRIALESLGIVVDRATRSLESVRALPLK